MNIITEAHKNLLADLLESGVQFLLIGGYAVNYHGYPRYTMDMDLWLKPAHDNRERFVTFLQKQDFSRESIDRVRELDFNIAQSFHLGEQETRIDFLTKISGSVEFNEAYSRCAKLSFGDITIPVIQYEDLILNKMGSNRPKDQADIDELQKIRGYRR